MAKYGSDEHEAQRARWRERVDNGGRWQTSKAHRNKKKKKKAKPAGKKKLPQILNERKKQMDDLLRQM